MGGKQSWKSGHISLVFYGGRLTFLTRKTIALAQGRTKVWSHGAFCSFWYVQVYRSLYVLFHYQVPQNAWSDLKQELDSADAESHIALNCRSVFDVVEGYDPDQTVVFAFTYNNYDDYWGPVYAEIKVLNQDDEVIGHSNQISIHSGTSALEDVILHLFDGHSRNEITRMIVNVNEGLGSHKTVYQRSCSLPRPDNVQMADNDVTLPPPPARLLTDLPTVTPTFNTDLPTLIQTPDQQSSVLLECIAQGDCTHTTGVYRSLLDGGPAVVIPDGKTLVISGLYVEIEAVDADGQPLKGLVANNRYVGFYGAIPAGYTINRIYVYNGEIEFARKDVAEGKLCSNVNRAINSGWAHESVFVLASWGPESCDGDFEIAGTINDLPALPAADTTGGF